MIGILKLDTAKKRTKMKGDGHVKNLANRGKTILFGSKITTEKCNKLRQIERTTRITKKETFAK